MLCYFSPILAKIFTNHFTKINWNPVAYITLRQPWDNARSFLFLAYIKSVWLLLWFELFWGFNFILLFKYFKVACPNQVWIHMFEFYFFMLCCECFHFCNYVQIGKVKRIRKKIKCIRTNFLRCMFKLIGMSFAALRKLCFNIPFQLKISLSIENLPIV